jgi:hypothetical protein
MYGRADALAGLLVTAQFSDGASAYDVLDMLASLTIEEITERLNLSFDIKRCALSVVKSADG